MSVPTEQQPTSPSPPPPFLDQHRQEAADKSQHGSSVGPMIAVLFVITFLSVVAEMIGRLCTGRGLFGHWEYDLEAWVETKCASCIDGHIVHDPVPPRQPHSVAALVEVGQHRQPIQACLADALDHTPSDNDETAPAPSMIFFRSVSDSDVLELPPGPGHLH